MSIGFIYFPECYCHSSIDGDQNPRKRHKKEQKKNQWRINFIKGWVEKIDADVGYLESLIQKYGLSFIGSYDGPDSYPLKKVKTDPPNFEMEEIDEYKKQKVKENKEKILPLNFGLSIQRLIFWALS